MDWLSAPLPRLPTTPELRSAIRTTVDATGLRTRFAVRHAVILERVAFGAGMTNWYYCRDWATFDVLQDRLGPGSAVTAYFDERIRKCSYSEEFVARARQVVAETGEVVACFLEPDEITLFGQLANSDAEIDEFAELVQPGHVVFYGVWPARDDDGVNAITFTVPDLDGVTRGHPH